METNTQECYLDDKKYVIEDFMKNNISSSYNVKNKGLYLLYNFYKKEFNNNISYEIICKIVAEVKKINDINLTITFPDYVLEFFDEIKTRIKMEKTKEKQKKILEDYDNEEYFMSEINFNMNESLNGFFGITDNDI